MTDPNFFVAVLTGIGLVAAVAAATLALLWIGCRILRLIERLFLGTVPERFSAVVAGMVRFYTAAALLCGLTAFALSLLILGYRWPAGLADPALRDPLLWLTWLAMMSGIMVFGIVGGLLARYVLETVASRLRGRTAKKP